MRAQTLSRPLLPRRFLALAALLLALVTTGLPLARPAEAFTTTHGVRLNAVEARLVYRINAARTSRGIAALRVVPGFTDVARRWAYAQARSQTMKHNPNMAAQLAAAGGSGWRTLGENVGTGWDADSLFNAYWNSAPHRANLLNPQFRYLGMGWVERPGGQGFNTQNFVSHYSTTYGRNRVPAFGGRGDSRTVTATQSIGSFEGGSDARIAATASPGLTSRVSVDAASDRDDAARMSVREVATGASSGRAGMVIRDSLNLQHAQSITLKLRAVSRTSRPVVARVYVRTVFGTSVLLGNVTLQHGVTRTVTLPLSTSARVWRNYVLIAVPRSSLQSLSGSRTYRSATVAVYDIRVNV